MAESANLRPDEIFHDIGSGLGQVAMLVHPLSGVRARGVEVEPAYCSYARRCVGRLNLSQIEFLSMDAREADYSDGTVFFLYMPCEGRMLERVLERIEDDSRERSIRLYTYGPYALPVSRQRWVELVDQNGNEANRLATFRALGRGQGGAQSILAPDQAFG
jgi:Histone methylation protein DOT1